MKRFVGLGLFAVLVSCLSVSAKDAVKDKKPVWMDPETVSKTNADYAVQGEYAAEGMGVQVIALGDGHFQAVVLPGGLPGAGWNKEEKILLDGKRDGEKTVFVPATGQRKYLNGPPNAFSATSTFPPKGQKSYKGQIAGEVLTVTTDAGKSIVLKKTVRKSPTLGMKAPEGAIVLFDGKKTDEINGGEVTQWGWLHTGKDNFIVSKRGFSSYILHVEFMTCFSPFCRGQSRGNSGCFQANGEEIQVLDSFGLDGKVNEAGGIYKWRTPDVNMALPPLTWQTYDIEYASGENGEPPTMTVRHNGVVIHNRLKMKKPSRKGNIRFQKHKDWVQYRNLWILEVKPDLDPTTEGK